MEEGLNKSEKTVKAIEQIIKILMDSLMEKVLRTDPFIEEEHHSKKPLYATLVPDEIFKGSHFERRFVTPFGGVWQKLACVAAEHGLGKCSQEYPIRGTVRAERLRRIQETLNLLEHTNPGEKKIKPDWNKELNYILEGGGELIPTIVNCDLYAENTATGERYSFEVKAPLPNSDQTKVSKEKIFKLYAMEPRLIDFAFFALPYNPFGTKDKYNWSFPKRWFNMNEDSCVLIGDELWNLIGGPGTYQMFIKEINKIGKAYRERIYVEYLAIKPPEGWDRDILTL